jgi:hypothetical protein
MDSLTLITVILVFVLCLGLYFATASSVSPQPTRIPIPSTPPMARKAPLFIFAHPAVLRQNVAVARLMRLEGQTTAQRHCT